MADQQLPYVPLTIEVNGESVLSIVHALPAFERRAREALTACGISDPQPGKWYPQQSLMNALKQITDAGGGGTLLFQVGKTMLTNAQFPPNISDFESAFGSMDAAYHMNHRRNGNIMFDPITGKMLEGIGHYTFRPSSASRSAEMICDNPYPCDFDQGLITAAARRFKPAGALLVNVGHKEGEPCRAHGGKSCTYLISW